MLPNPVHGLRFRDAQLFVAFDNDGDVLAGCEKNDLVTSPVDKMLFAPLHDLNAVEEPMILIGVEDIALDAIEVAVQAIPLMDRNITKATDKQNK